MITLTTTKAKLLFVEVPDDAIDFGIWYNEIMVSNKLIKAESSIGYRFSAENYKTVILPSGSTYTFLFTTKQGREEDWKGVVTGIEWTPREPDGEPTGEPDKILWHDYADVKWFVLDTATESGLSLQKANGMDVNKNYAVIKID